MREAIRSPIRLPIGPLVRPSPRLDSTAYAVGDVRTFGGFIHRCVFQGISDVTEPTIIAPIGAGDVVVNGGFDADTNWDKLGTTTISSGVAHVATPSAMNALTQTTLPVSAVGKAYLIAYELSAYVSGVIRAGYGAGYTDYESSNGAYSQVVTPSVGSPNLILNTGGAAAQMDIDNVTLQEVTGDGTAAWETIG